MGESNLKNNQKDKGTPSKKDVDSSNVQPYVYKRKKRISSFYPLYFLLVMLSMGWAAFSINSQSYNTKNMENIISTATPIPIEVQEDILIEFSDQEISFDCKAYDYRNFYLIEWNGTIKIVVHETEFDYVDRSRGGLLMLPEFSTFVDDYNDLTFEHMDDKRCYVNGDFVYNITIAGKTVSNSHHIRFEDCQEEMRCKIGEYFNNIVS